MNNGRFVIFTSTPEQMKGYWLNDYFPDAMVRSTQQMPSLDRIVSKLKSAGFSRVTTEIYEVKSDLQDLFLYSGKERPEFYLTPCIRGGISMFANLADKAEIKTGCKRLTDDIETGKIKAVISSYIHANGGYLFVIAEK